MRRTTGWRSGLIALAMAAPAAAAGPGSGPPGGQFGVACKDVNNVQGSNGLSWTCIPPTGPAFSVAPWGGNDVTPVTQQSREEDRIRSLSIEGVVTSFFLLKRTVPNAPATLVVFGKYSSTGQPHALGVILQQ